MEIPVEIHGKIDYCVWFAMYSDGEFQTRSEIPMLRQGKLYML